MADHTTEYWQAGSQYKRFVKNEGIPVHEGYYIQDVKEVDVGHWGRTGVNGAFVNLVGHEGINDLHIHELPPGATTNPQQHLYEEIVFVVGGTGATAIGPEDEESVFEWDENSLFVIPRNTRYRHLNTNDEQPVRLMSETDLPSIFTLFRDESFIFENNQMFVDATEPSYYSGDGTIHEGERAPIVWESNFIPDTLSFENMEHFHERGAGGGTVVFNHPDTSLWSHISQFPAGTYKKAHRHHPGANVTILSGEGYSLMWPSDAEDESERIRIDWQPGTVFAPPALWWHQHFNLAETPSRYLALHPSDFVFAGGDNDIFDPIREYNNMQYPDENPEIREQYEETMAERGLNSRMPDEAYQDPDYSFDQKYESMRQADAE